MKALLQWLFSGRVQPANNKDNYMKFGHQMRSAWVEVDDANLRCANKANREQPELTEGNERQLRLCGNPRTR